MLLNIWWLDKNLGQKTCIVVFSALLRRLWDYNERNDVTDMRNWFLSVNDDKSACCALIFCWNFCETLARTIWGILTRHWISDSVQSVGLGWERAVQQPTKSKSYGLLNRDSLPPQPNRLDWESVYYILIKFTFYSVVRCSLLIGSQNLAKQWSRFMLIFISRKN